MNRNLLLLSQAVAVIIVVVGVVAALNAMASRLPLKVQRFSTPILLIGPAFVLLALMYLLPTVLTVLESLRGSSGDFVGLENYARAAQNPGVIEALHERDMIKASCSPSALRPLGPACRGTD